jgi:hypothetical protein
LQPANLCLRETSCLLGCWKNVFTKNICTKMLISILISISSKSWGAALCGCGGPHVWHGCLREMSLLRHKVSHNVVSSSQQYINPTSHSSYSFRHFIWSLPERSTLAPLFISTWIRFITDFFNTHRARRCLICTLSVMEWNQQRTMKNRSSNKVSASFSSLSLCPSACLSHSTYLTTYLSTCLIMYISVYLAIYWTTNPPTYQLLIHPPIHQPIHQSVRPSLYVSLFPSICLRIYQSVHLSVLPSIHPSI